MGGKARGLALEFENLSLVSPTYSRHPHARGHTRCTDARMRTHALAAMMLMVQHSRRTTVATAAAAATLGYEVTGSAAVRLNPSVPL
eukprot:SAG11_NODE_2047_length_3884_cov_1.573844_3_plen_87_part_00